MKAPLVLLMLLIGCSGGSAARASETAKPSSAPSPTAESMSAAPAPIPSLAVPARRAICDDATFWASFMHDAEGGLYSQGQVHEELRAFLPALQRDVLAAGGASTQAALQKLVPAGTAALADQAGSFSWRLDLATFGLDLKSVLKHLPNCQLKKST